MWNHNGISTGNQGRRRGQVSVWYLVLFAVALVVIGILVVRQVRRATSTPVWVAKGELAAGTKVGSNSIELKRVANDSIPDGAVHEPSQIVGRVLKRAVNAGQPLAQGDIDTDAGNIWAASVIPEGRVLATVRFSGVNLPSQQMRRGDRIDILAVTRDGATRLVGRDTYLMAVVSGARSGDSGTKIGSLIAPPVFRSKPQAGPVALLLALHPSDVAPIAQAEAAGEQLKFALHGEQELKSGNMLDILTARNSGQVDVIAGAHRQKVNVNP